MPKENGIGFGELHIQLRILNRLIAAGLKATMKQNELIAILASTGASNKEIADVLDTTPATVNVALARLRKKAIKSSSDETGSSESGIEG